jgi:hypothetical protein
MFFIVYTIYKRIGNKFIQHTSSSPFIKVFHGININKNTPKEIQIETKLNAQSSQY